jgi:NAD(P)-dependent dehydrogenase (short-subunit alcohol dehydrogenase family)
MADQQPVALVTGGNRGIGKEVVRQLADRGFRVILTARDLKEGEAAAAELSAGGAAVLARLLDVTDSASLERLTRSVAEEFGRLDVLVNNAGVSLKPDVAALAVDPDTVQATLATNLLGPWRVCQAFAPLLKKSPHGRVVNVSSQLGQLSTMGRGYPAYRVSKAALTALTRILADELRDSGVLVNACCPRWVRTDMGGPQAPRPVAEGADTPVWLATLPDGGPTGGFFQDRRPLPW